jgi:CBS domain-containing protein
MKISQVMTRDVRVIRPDRSARDAAKLMDDLNVGVLPVCDGERLVGIVTDRDITVRATAFNKPAADTPVSEVMTVQTLSCSEGDDLEDVLKLMGDAQVRRLPVLNREREIVGIVSLGDLATRSSKHTDEVLRDVSWPSEPDRPQGGQATH